MPDSDTFYEVDSGELRESLVILDPSRLVEQLEEIYRHPNSGPLSSPAGRQDLRRRDMNSVTFELEATGCIVL